MLIQGAGAVPSDPDENTISLAPPADTVTSPGDPLPVDQVTCGVPGARLVAVGIGSTVNVGRACVPAAEAVFSPIERHKPANKHARAPGSDLAARMWLSGELARACDQTDSP